MLSFKGFGTYVGLIFVFLTSKPTMETPLGTMTPPIHYSTCRECCWLMIDQKSDVVEKGEKSNVVVPCLSI